MKRKLGLLKSRVRLFIYLIFIPFGLEAQELRDFGLEDWIEAVKKDTCELSVINEDKILSMQEAKASLGNILEQTTIYQVADKNGLCASCIQLAIPESVRMFSNLSLKLDSVRTSDGQIIQLENVVRTVKNASFSFILNDQLILDFPLEKDIGKQVVAVYGQSFMAVEQAKRSVIFKKEDLGISQNYLNNKIKLLVWNDSYAIFSYNEMPNKKFHFVTYASSKLHAECTSRYYYISYRNDVDKFIPKEKEIPAYLLFIAVPRTKFIEFLYPSNKLLHTTSFTVKNATN